MTPLARATRADFIVIGGGIAGASIAWRLAAAGSVILLEAEDRPGLHSTGRSAAMFDRAYGNSAIRALTAASHEFFLADSLPGLERPLLTPRGVMYVATPAQHESLLRFHASIAALAPAARIMDGAFARARVPILRADVISECLWDPTASDIDVATLHVAWLRAFRQRGGTLACDRRVEGLERKAGHWHVHSHDARYEAGAVINAAGAWADQLSGLAGLAPLGLQPMRRSIAVVPLPADLDARTWPMTVDLGEQWYFKGEAGRVLVSPADETHCPPCDACADDLDLALGIERVEAATTLDVRRVTGSWAGLRSFFPDRTPVLGRDPRAPGFHWFAGLGGYGIQTAPAASAVVAAAVLGQPSLAPEMAADVTADRFIY